MRRQNGFLKKPVYESYNRGDFAMAKIVKLAICHKCHNRILDGQLYINYKNEALYHDSCFIEYLEEFDLTELITNDIMTSKDTSESDNNEDLDLSSYKDI